MIWGSKDVRWTVSHSRELVPSAAVRRGERVSPLPRALVDFDDLPITAGDVTMSLTEALQQSDVDGFLVIQRGTVVFERYLTMQPETSHILQSVSKSMTAALVGVLVGEGRIHPDDLVPDHLSELAGSCWDGCTIEHLLDMRAGVAFNETDYEDEASESYRGFRVLGWLPRLEDDPSPTDYIAAMSLQGPHGGPFEYRSILTDVLGWCLERASGEPLASLFASRIWQPMGAGHDADLLLGPGGFPLVDGGFCVTLADLARFGLMFLQGGAVDGRQVVPAEWVQRLRSADADRIEAFRSSPDSHDMPPTAFYRDQWWVRDAEAGIYSGYGIHGQQVLVHQPSECVVARMSSWPRPWDDDAARLGDAAAFAVCAALG
ncbi:serine hydrolase [Gaiella sp.]|uniref:serine hydrolase domain-containing protein n=1 Tax=Gaiella sp. TaxID=2663207 RepID=UPI00326398C9